MLPVELQTDNQVSLGTVRRLLEDANLETRAAILEFVRTQQKQIQPKPDDEWFGTQWLKYYIDCISTRDNFASDDGPLSRFEAASALVELFAWTLKCEEEWELGAQTIAQEVERLFRESNGEMQNIIETGFLEHALEFPLARPFFEHWDADASLRESYRAALAWGLADTRDVSK